MKINFDELSEIEVPNMNGGNGIVKSKMFIPKKNVKRNTNRNMFKLPNRNIRAEPKRRNTTQ